MQINKTELIIHYYLFIKLFLNKLELCLRL